MSDAPESVTIGVPPVNTETLVLDDRLKPVPAGVPGVVSRWRADCAPGYAGQPGLTAERSSSDPYGVEGSRLYRTGDAVRWNADRQYRVLGRPLRCAGLVQVKLRASGSSSVDVIEAGPLPVVWVLDALSGEFGGRQPISGVSEHPDGAVAAGVRRPVGYRSGVSEPSRSSMSVVTRCQRCGWLLVLVRFSGWSVCSGHL